MIRNFVTLIFLAAIALTGALPGNAQTVAEQYLVQLANQHRAEHGLAPLVWDSALASAARTHALRVMRETSVEHQYAGEPDLTARASRAGAHFSTVAENLAGTASDIVTIDRSWMASPTHRANILDPQLTSIGIAVLTNRNGFYAVQDFARQTPSLRPGDIEQQVSELLRASGIRPNTDRAAMADARTNCALPTEITGHPKLVVQWDGADLNQLPTAVLQQMPSARSHTAAIGACPGQNPSNDGFTTYHVAVLLY
jgi:Cysteine-rich secretory protein family